MRAAKAVPTMPTTMPSSSSISKGQVSWNRRGAGRMFEVSASRLGRARLVKVPSPGRRR